MNAFTPFTPEMIAARRVAVARASVALAGFVAANSLFGLLALAVVAFRV